MTRRTLICGLGACTCPSFAAQNDPVFRSDVSLIRVDASVSDASGRILTDLTKDDFRVFDDGKPQPILSFSFEEEPLDVVLLFDTGGNMHSKSLPLIRAVELGFHELKPGDRAAVMVYSGFSVQLLPLTANFGAVNDAILLGVLKQRFGGPSKLVLATDDAAKHFLAEPTTHRRRAILAISDKTAGKQSDTDALRDLWQANAVLSELILANPPQPTDAVVEKTGGSTLAAGSDPGAAFQESLRRLRRRYTLYYAMPPGAPGTERTIRLESRPGTKIAARNGYTIG